MALAKSALETALKGIFSAMSGMTEGGDAYLAAQAAAALAAYILSGRVSTADTGAAPGGAYAGAGVGTTAIDAAALSRALRATFEAGYGDDDLAARIADDIGAACEADDTVTIVSTGAVTTPSGATSPFSGPGQGKFTGARTNIETALKACFSAMTEMTEGGDAYFAAQWATAVDAYLRAGAVGVTLEPPFASGSGAGAIA
jgi:hypothetical protein